MLVGWVLATNVGWFSKIALGTWLAEPPTERSPFFAAMATGAVAELGIGRSPPDCCWLR